LCDLNRGDIDLEKRIIIVKHGKGNKARNAFIGNACRNDLVKYLDLRPEIKDEDPLFSHKTGKRFTRGGIESVIDGLAKTAKIKPPSPHDFRRAFTKAALRRTDVLSVARLLGHSDTSLVWKYYYQNTDDLQKAHEVASPVDNMLL
jgi:integrase